jgi:predicted DNA-binding transcriptional regulator AlpA
MLLRLVSLAPTEDRLLVIADAAARLAVSKDWLYRHADRLPFTVRLSNRQPRFSAKGIDRYIASRVGHHRR